MNTPLLAGFSSPFNPHFFQRKALYCHYFPAVDFPANQFSSGEVPAISDGLMRDYVRADIDLTELWYDIIQAQELGNSIRRYWDGVQNQLKDALHSVGAFSDDPEANGLVTVVLQPFIEGDDVRIVVVSKLANERAKMLVLPGKNALLDTLNLENVQIKYGP